MFGIIHNKTRQYLRINGMWSIESHHPFINYTDASVILTRDELDAHIIGEVQPNYVKVDHQVTRVDRNMDFIKEINEKAAKFKMNSVGIKSIDKLINKDIGIMEHYPIKSTKFHLCEIGDTWCEVSYENVKTGIINIISYVENKYKPVTNDRVAFLRCENNNTMCKLVTGLYNHTKKLNIDGNEIDYESKEYEIGNPHEFLKMVEGIINTKITEVKQSNVRRVFNNTMKLMCFTSKGWYHVRYNLVNPGHVIILDYKRSTVPPIKDERIGVLENNSRFGISKLWMEVHGDRYKKDESFVVDNFHNIR